MIPRVEVKTVEGRMYNTGSTQYNSQSLSGYNTLVYALGAGSNDLTVATGNDYMRVISGIAAGDNNDNRDGSNVVLQSFVMSGVVSAGTAQSGADIARLLLVYDNSPVGALPLFSDIFASAGTGPTDATLVAPNLSNRARFSILHDQRWTIDTSDSSRLRQVKLYKRLNLPAIYKSGSGGSTAGIGAMSQGVVYLFLLGGNTSASQASTSVPYFKGEMKLYFHE